MPSSLEQRSLEEGFLRLAQAKELVMKNNNQSFLQKISAHLTVGPALLIIATGLWIATIGNIPLWKALSQLPEGVDAKFFTGFLTRSEEHTSELQSQSNLVCRLLLEKKKNNNV